MKKQNLKNLYHEKEKVGQRRVIAYRPNTNEYLMIESFAKHNKISINKALIILLGSGNLERLINRATL